MLMLTHYIVVPDGSTFLNYVGLPHKSPVHSLIHSLPARFDQFRWRLRPLSRFPSELCRFLEWDSIPWQRIAKKDQNRPSTSFHIHLRFDLFRLLAPTLTRTSHTCFIVQHTRPSTFRCTLMCVSVCRVSSYTYTKTRWMWHHQ